jgi:hypothetical protein
VQKVSIIGLKRPTFVFGLLVVLQMICWPSRPVAAQSLFCPAGQTFENGFCVNRTMGPAVPTCPAGWGPVSFGPQMACVGLGNSPAQSQTLVTTIQSTVQESNSSALEIASARRADASQPCRTGYQSINGACQPISSGNGLNYAAEQTYASDMSFGRMVVKAVPSSFAAATIQSAIWAQFSGDLEKRTETTGSAAPSLNGVMGVLQTPQGANQILSLSTNVGRTTNTGNFSEGMDFTFLNFLGTSDTFVIGMLSGYTSSRITYAGSTNTSDVFGPSIGVYGSYVKGAFSVDATIRTDFLTQNQTFADFTGTPFAVSGTSSVHVNNYSVAADVNYRFPLANALFFEPTAGISHTRADYDSSAAAVGLSNGDSTRLLGGGRVGANFNLGQVAVKSTLTALAYDDVSTTGGATAQGGFALTGVIPTDAGKVTGQLLWASFFDFGRGFSATIGADVRFRGDLLGVGGRAGLRYRW